MAILKRLAASRAALFSMVAELPEATLDWRMDGGWSIREILTHLVNAEEDHRRVIEVVARGEAHRVPTELDMNAHNEQRVSERGHLLKSDLLVALSAQRAATERLYQQLDAGQLSLIAPHPVLGDQTLEAIFRIIGLHERQHTRDIAAILDR